MVAADHEVTDARNLLRSIVDRWNRQRHSGVVKDRAEEFLSFLDSAIEGTRTAAEWTDIRAQSQPLREAVTAADAHGYESSLLAAARSLLRVIDNLSASQE